MKKCLLGNSTNKSGFTIVELLVVIVVIGILAAVVFVSYGGITRRSAEATVLSDLTNASKQINIDYVNNGAYPLSSLSANSGKGLPYSSGTNYFYNHDYDSYCLSANSVAAGSGFSHISSTSGAVVGGDCSYSQSLLANLVAFWRMDETSGLVLRDSIGSNNGTITSTGAINNQQGIIKRGYSFNGAQSGYINLAHMPLDGTPLSISYWQNSTLGVQVGNPGVIAAHDATSRNFNVINRVGDHIVTFRTWDEIGGDDTMVSITPVLNGSWHHVVCVITGTQKQIYVDGVLDSQISWVHYLKPDPNGIDIGKAINNGTFNGFLDEMGIWTRALSPAEIVALYNNGSGLQYP